MSDASEIVWTVDRYTDSVRARKKSDVLRDIRVYGNLMYFELKGDAISFLINRAYDRLEKAENEVQREKRRVRNCLKLQESETAIRKKLEAQ